MAECLAWGVRERLPVAWLEHLFVSYVEPASLYGIEILHQASCVRMINQRRWQWGA